MRVGIVGLGAIGGTLAAPIWAAFAARAYAHRAVPAPWQPPPGLVGLRVRRNDGVPVPADTTDASYVEWFRPGTEPTPQAIGARMLRHLRGWPAGWP